ncbi:aspartate aminotransferase family protein [Ruegeria sp. Ofav3-42]|uniref:aspartate aminotransferase family protein n=1 Tax=Ruegeria sp. Ofav3-42 TaxID=2917759 RepID=UPI001EF51DA0|nr:aspartate aminotransferase family protein [Ruegeria sp. Ofav3-42]MCG7521951.1 aspartate aminotransferase family protein [Ruegeria sp. Ofav3-42]
MSSPSELKLETDQLAHVKFDGYDVESTTSAALIARRAKHFAGSFLFYQDPIEIVSGKGARLTDQKGRQYIDFYNNVQSMGHSNPDVARAIAKAYATLTTHTRYLNKEVIELAEEAVATLPGELDVCLFVNSGTEAAELAMRIARVVTGKTGIAVLENSYHGNSKLVGEMSTGTYPAANRPDYIQAIAPPNLYRGQFTSANSDPATLGRRYADLLYPAIDALERNGHGLSAFVCDSIFDSHGVLEAPADYFQQVYRKVRAAGGLCVADEVQAGVCRTGTFWGFEQYDVIPDIVFCGKPFGCGYPVAAVFTTRAIADYWAKRDIYFNTFGGNPVAAAAARAVIHYARRNNIPTHVNEMGRHLRKKLGELAQRHPMIGNIRGKGLFVGVELVKDQGTKEPATDIARYIPDEMKKRGVLIGLSGPLGNCLKFRPPLVITKADIDRTVRIFDEVLTRLRRQAKKGAMSSVGRVNEGIVNERVVLAANKRDQRELSVSRSVAITPLAWDLARQLGVKLHRDRF